jgi:hypothetical protein
MISLRPGWRAQRPNQHHKINDLIDGMPVDHVIKRKMQYRGKE